MSEKNRDGKRSARERLTAERQAREARARRNRKLAVLGSVVTVLAVAVGVGVVVQSRRSKPETPQAAPSGAVGDRKLAIPDGSAGAPSVLTVYEDPRCPACKAFEKALHTTVDTLMDQGKLFGNYHIVSFIDRHDAGTGSKNGANALACAQDAGPGRFRGLHNVMYANQPDENDDAWSDRGKLITLARQVPGLVTPTFEKCVNADTYSGWVSAVQQDFDRSGNTSTPTVLLNGEPVFPKKGSDVISEANLVKWVDEANKGKRLGSSVSPSPSAGAHRPSPAASHPAAAPHAGAVKPSASQAAGRTHSVPAHRASAAASHAASHAAAGTSAGPSPSVTR